jgi:hypothetical protein
MSLEVLNVTLVLFSRFATVESAKVSALSRLWIFFA